MRHPDSEGNEELNDESEDDIADFSDFNDFFSDLGFQGIIG